MLTLAKDGRNISPLRQSHLEIEMKSTVEAVDNHAAIFNAYLSRLSLKDIDSIHEAIRRCWIAQNNLGTASQLAYQNDQLEVVKEVLGKWMKSDLLNINIIIERSL